ncbi:MAG: hypothetical protein WBZ40_04275 [Acidimicrobiia bacterium]
MNSHPALAYVMAQQMLVDLRDEAAGHRQARHRRSERKARATGGRPRQGRKG